MIKAQLEISLLIIDLEIDFDENWSLNQLAKILATTLNEPLIYYLITY
jgi:hypothetical protein